MVEGQGHTVNGFHTCQNLSSCHVENLILGGIEYLSCSNRDLESCD